MADCAQILVAACVLSAAQSVRYPPPLPPLSLLDDHPLHAHLNAHHGLPPGPPPLPPSGPGLPMFPMHLRDQSHGHPALLPPPPEPGLPPGPAPGPPPGRPTMPHRLPHWSALLGYQRPMDAMVDITNELGVTVLQDHAYSRGNFAFSPYGVASVLVVLYEGARGESARQVHTALKLPWDRDVTRVGFRDVHRNLRSYFSHEGYLSGVTLSQSRTALLPEFRRVLRFYGYDVDLPPDGFNYTDTAGPVVTVTSDVRPPTANSSTPAPSSSNTAVSSTTEGSAATTSTTTPTATENGLTVSTQESSSTAESSSSPEVTTQTEVDAVSSAPLSASVPTTTPIPPGTLSDSASKEEKPTTPASNTEDTTPEITVAPASENEVDGATPASLLSPSLLDMKPNAFAGILIGSRLQEQFNSLFPDGLVESRENDIDLGASDVWTTHPSEPQTTTSLPLDEEESDPEPTTTDTDALVERTAIGILEAAVADALAQSTVPNEDAATETTETESSFTTETPQLTTTDMMEEIGEEEPVSTEEANSDVTTPVTETDPPMTTSKRQGRGAAIRFWTGLEAASALNASRHRRDVNGGFPDLSLQLQNGMFDSHVATGDELFTQLARRPFLVDGAFEEPVPVMEYTATFPFAYIPRLHALALEFPLDDERYRLLLLLPVERTGLRQLLHGLGRVPLRDVVRSLRPTRLHAVVPSFMVEGFVILTPTLQQIGIWDMFDPRRADLSGMTDDPELYVRNIEQAVTVVVKNYVEILDIQTRTTAARSRLDQFIATHPFLYFVMDSETQVSLMAGKVVDPLNSRIY